MSAQPPDRGSLLHPLPHAGGGGEVFEDLLRCGKLRIERIVSRGDATPPGEWYDQAQDEWVLVVAGEGEIEFEDGGAHQSIILGPGDWVRIPAGLRHRVLRTANPTVWLAVWLPPEGD